MSAFIRVLKTVSFLNDDMRQSGGISTDLVIEPYAGRVPWMKDPAMLLAPNATSSRFGLMEYPNRAPFCFAATILSRKPIMAMRLESVNHHLIPLRVKNSHCRWGRAMDVLEITPADRELEKGSTGFDMNSSKDIHPVFIPVVICRQCWRVLMSQGTNT